MKKRSYFLLVAMAMLVILPGSVSAADYFVPDDFATIQDAIDGVIGGDTIIVRDDTYTGAGNKNLDFNGKAIILRSENGAENCIIDCENDGRAFYFHNFETSTSVVDGFTIINGESTFAGVFPDGWGGAICCVNSSPAIRNCVISGSQVSGGETSSGGGISCYAYSSPTIMNCLIEGNSADWGGAIYCNFYSSPLINNCTMVGNSAQGGGAIYTANGSAPVITDSIMWNDAASSGPEIAVVQNSSLIVGYSDVEGGRPAAVVMLGSTLIWGAGNINADPLFVSGPLGDYYLSQIASGQGSDSPCVNAGSSSAISVGLNSSTTRTDHAGDSGTVDMGYHYGEGISNELTRINLTSPDDLATLSLPPTFTWSTDGGSNNVFAIDVALSLRGPIYSTYEDLHLLIRTNSWTMPQAIWDRISSGERIYWRVRGADLDAAPLNIIYSEEAWSFYKE